MRDLEAFDDDSHEAGEGSGSGIELDLPRRHDDGASGADELSPGGTAAPADGASAQPSTAARPDEASLPPILAPTLASPPAPEPPAGAGAGGGDAAATPLEPDAAVRGAAAGARLVARYPTPPESVWRLPAYAGQVLIRQFELRQDLVSLRRRRSPDVPLYESALRAYEPKAFQTGLILGLAAFILVTLIVFSPVIVRFASN